MKKTPKNYLLFVGMIAGLIGSIFMLVIASLILSVTLAGISKFGISGKENILTSSLLIFFGCVLGIIGGSLTYKNGFVGGSLKLAAFVLFAAYVIINFTTTAKIITSTFAFTLSIPQIVLAGGILAICGQAKRRKACVSPQEPVLPQNTDNLISGIKEVKLINKKPGDGLIIAGVVLGVVGSIIVTFINAVSISFVRLITIFYGNLPLLQAGVSLAIIGGIIGLAGSIISSKNGFIGGGLNLAAFLLILTEFIMIVSFNKNEFLKYTVFPYAFMFSILVLAGGILAVCAQRKLKKAPDLPPIPIK